MYIQLDLALFQKKAPKLYFKLRDYASFKKYLLIIRLRDIYLLNV